MTPVAGCALGNDDLDAAWVPPRLELGYRKPGPMLRQAQIRARAKGGSDELDFSNVGPEP